MVRIGIRTRVNPRSVVVGALALVSCGGGNGLPAGGTIYHFDGTRPTLSFATGGANNRYLQAVWGQAADDVWAVGFEGTILHWQGSRWSRVGSGTTTMLSSVWGSGHDDVWAVGWAGSILRWDGNAWAAVTSGTTANLLGVWGSGPNDVWAVGDKSTLLHWDGTTWAASSFLSPGASYLTFYGVHGSGPNDLWVVGDDGDDVIVHWDGASWAFTRTGDDRGLFGVWSVAPDDVWITTGSGILHSIGGGWSRQFPAEEVTRVWASGPDDVWFVGEQGALHFDGVALATISATGFGTLTAVWGSGPGDVWFVGGIED